MTLSSPSAIALWQAEVLPQLSDGAWENTTPFDHWKFWWGLDVVLGDEDIVRPLPGAAPRRNNYNIVGLAGMKHEGSYVLRPRMLAYGRLGRVLGPPYDDEILSAVEAAAEGGRDCGGPLVLDAVPAGHHALQQALAAAPYDVHDLYCDLERITRAVRSVPTPG